MILRPCDVYFLLTIRITDPVLPTVHTFHLGRFARGPSLEALPMNVVATRSSTPGYILLQLEFHHADWAVSFDRLPIVGARCEGCVHGRLWRNRSKLKYGVQFSREKGKLVLKIFTCFQNVDQCLKLPIR